MSLAAMGRVWDVAAEAGLGSRETLALVALADRHHDRDGMAVLAMTELARRIRGHRATAQRCAARLEAAGLIVRDDTGMGGRPRGGAARWRLPWAADPSHDDATRSAAVRPVAQLRDAHPSHLGAHTRRIPASDPSQSYATDPLHSPATRTVFHDTDAQSFTDARAHAVAGGGARADGSGRSTPDERLLVELERLRPDDDRIPELRERVAAYRGRPA
jgi:hypothetical protein